MYMWDVNCQFGALVWLDWSVASCHVTYTYCTIVTLGWYHVRMCTCTRIWEVSLVCSSGLAWSGLAWPGLAWLVGSFVSCDILYLLYCHVILQNRRQCTLYHTVDTWRQLPATHITVVTHTVMCTIMCTWRYIIYYRVAIATCRCLTLRRIKLCLNCLQPLGKGFLVG